MPGMSLARMSAGETGAPVKRPYPVGNSITYRQGDFLCLSTLNALASGTPALRLLATADLTALYETAANDRVGLLGICTDDVVANSSGYANATSSMTTLAAGVQPTYNPATVAASLPADSTGRSRMCVEVITPDMSIAGVLLETTTITEALIDTQVGLSMVVTSGVTAFKWSTAATTKIGRIAAVHTQDRKFSLSGGGGRVFVRIYPEYCQTLTGFNYAT